MLYPLGLLLCAHACMTLYMYELSARGVCAHVCVHMCACMWVRTLHWRGTCVKPTHALSEHYVHKYLVYGVALHIAYQQTTTFIGCIRYSGLPCLIGIKHIWPSTSVHQYPHPSHQSQHTPRHTITLPYISHTITPPYTSHHHSSTLHHHSSLYTSHHHSSTLHHHSSPSQATVSIVRGACL